MFKLVKQVWQQTRADIIESDIEKTMKMLISGGEDVMKIYAEHLIKYHSAVSEKKPNMTKEGQVKMGKELQKKARLVIDVEMAQASAMWMVGAWLETAHLPSEKAEEAHNYICEMIREIKKKLDSGEDIIHKNYRLPYEY